MLITTVAWSFFAVCGFSLALPSRQANGNVLEIRASKEVNPNAVTGTTCLDKNV